MSLGRVTAYVDGFNLYFGIKEISKACYWLDVRALAAGYLRADQELTTTKYFTARISGPPDKKIRQEAYLDALKTVDSLSIFEGKYMPRIFTCPGCRQTTSAPNEKMTDVNIATEVLVDAFDDSFDTAFLISGDSDLVPAVRHVLRRFPTKRVVVVFPPKRVSSEMRALASASLHVRAADLRRCQFPDVIQRGPYPALHRPQTWR